MPLQPYIGARKEIAFTKEVTRGTGVNYSAGDFQPHLGFDYGPKVSKIKDDPAMGRIEDNFRSAVVQRNSEGSIPLRLTKDFVGHILVMLFGQSPTSTGPVGNIYTHTFALKNDNQHQSYSINIKDPIKGFVRYPLAMLNELSLEFAVDSVAKATLGMMGGKEEAGTPGATSYSTTYEYPFFLPQQLEIKFADTVAGLSGATETFTKSFSLTASKNCENHYALGEEGPIDIINQRFGIGIKLDEAYEQTSLRDWAHNNITKAMQIKVDDGAGDVLTITLPRVAFEDWSSDNDNGAYMKDTVAIFAERDNTNGMISATLANQVTSY